MADCTPVTVPVKLGDSSTSQFPVPPPSLRTVDFDAASGFPLTLVAATASMIVRVYGFRFDTVGGDVTITMQDGAMALPGVLALRGGEVRWRRENLLPLWQTAAGSAFKLNASVNVQLTGSIDVLLASS